MEHTIEESVTIKRELSKFMNRFFYSREKNKENLARMYFYLDDFIRYVSDLQVKVANELLATNFTEVFLEDENIKIYNDTELKTILIDSISQKEKSLLLATRNKAYVEGMKH